METQIQQTEYADASTANNMMTIQSSEAGSLVKIPKTDTTHNKGSEIGRNISIFLHELPKNIAEFSSEYKLQVISFVLLVVMMIGLRFVVAIIGAINQIPLASTFFEVIGIGYVTWLVSRYFFTEATGRF